MGDVLFIIAFLGLLIIPFVIFAIKSKQGFWYWVGTIATMGICLGGGELWSKIATGKSLSSNFCAMIILSCMFAAWVLLMFHLAWKIIKRKFQK